jgi:hypothetical protein
VDVGSEFISLNDSCNGSGERNQASGNEGNGEGNEEVEISMNNIISNELYLPISKDKPCLKQEIETFKEHLYLVNNNNNQSVRKSY